MNKNSTLFFTLPNELTHFNISLQYNNVNNYWYHSLYTDNTKFISKIGLLTDFKKRVNSVETYNSLFLFINRSTTK